jgi:hypothetical protein
MYMRGGDLILFSVMDINRAASVVNAVLKEDGVVYGTYIVIFCFLSSTFLTSISG